MKDVMTTSEPSHHSRGALLGQQLRAARQRLQLSQEELADQAGVSVRTVRNLETAQVRAPHPSSVRKLCAALELPQDPLDDLVALGTGTEAAPYTMPPDIADFVGRDPDVAAVSTDLLAGGPGLPIIGIYGRPGVGKTALAVHMAHRLRHHFRDGGLYVHMAAHGPKPIEPIAALNRLLSALGVSQHDMPDTVDARAELFRQLVADRRILVVLDNATDAAQVRPLLPGTSASAVIVTSRRRLGDLEGARHRALVGFSSTEALRLLESIVGAERVVAEAAAAESLAARCDYLPLAIRIAGAKLSQLPHRSFGWLSGQLEVTRKRLDTLAAGELAVRTTLASAYDALGSSARLTLRLLAQLGLPNTGTWLVAAAMGLPLEHSSDCFDVLVESGLLQPPRRDDAGQDRYELHDLIHAFAIERADVEDAPSEIRQRVARAVTAAWLRAEAATAHLDDDAAYGDRPERPPQGTVDDGFANIEAKVAWLRAETTGLVSLVRTACQYGLVDEAWGLARALQPYFDTGGYVDQMEQTNVALRNAADEHKHPAAEVCALIGLADVAQIRGLRRESLATMTRAREAAQRIGASRSAAVTEHLIASTYRLLGDFEAARHWIDVAIGHARTLNDGNLVLAVCLHEAGQQTLVMGDDPERAVSLLEEAWRVSGAVQSARRHAIASLRLAQAYRSLGASEDAHECLRSAIGTSRELRDRVGEGYLMLELGELYRGNGDHDCAEEAFVEAGRILRDAGRPTGEVLAAERLARLYTERGDRRAARQILQDALPIGRERG
jgi:transcriptional regulator with XRE-family HTH domain/tetratricopeptide (TPR) repeat protein